jgi:arylformamidase
MSHRGPHYFDISLPLTPDLPVWPGDDDVSVEPLRRIANGDDTNVTSLAFTSHVGTHVDAPWHFVDEGAKLNDLSIDRWIGPCLVIQIPEDAQRIEVAHLAAADISEGTERLLFRTSNSARWRPGKLTFEEDYVAVSPPAAHWIVEHGIRLVGIDYLSIESFDDAANETHRTLLGNDVLVIEGLNLAGIDPGPYQLVCLPLRLVSGDGAPARVVLIREP